MEGKHGERVIKIGNSKVGNHNFEWVNQQKKWKQSDGNMIIKKKRKSENERNHVET